MKGKISKILRQEFVKNFIKIFSSNALINVLPLFFVPIFSRVFLPEDYGRVALLVSLSTLFAAVASLRYELAIVLAKEEEEAFNIIKLCSVILVVFTFCLALFCFGFGYFGFSDQVTLLAAIPLATFIANMTNITRNWAIRKKSFGLIAKAAILGLITGTLSKFYFAFQNFSHEGLIYSALIGSSSTMLLLLFNALKSIDLSYWSFSNLEKVAKRFLRLPKFDVAQTLIDSLNTHGLVYLISGFYGAQMLGQYSMAEKFLKVPVRFIGSAISPVFYQNATEKHQQGHSIFPIVQKVIMSLSMLALPVVVFTSFFGERFFQIALGQQWMIAGKIASIIIFWAMIRFVSTPVASIPIILKKNKTYFLLSIIYNLVLGATLVICYVINLDLVQMTMYITLVSVMYFTYIIYWFWRLSKTSHNV